MSITLPRRGGELPHVHDKRSIAGQAKPSVMRKPSSRPTNQKSRVPLAALSGAGGHRLLPGALSAAVPTFCSPFGPTLSAASGLQMPTAGLGAVRMASIPLVADADEDTPLAARDRRRRAAAARKLAEEQSVQPAAGEEDLARPVADEGGAVADDEEADFAPGRWSMDDVGDRSCDDDEEPDFDGLRLGV